MKITDKEFNDLSSFVKKFYGINLTDKKKTLVMTRLNFVLIKYDVNNFAEYIDMIKKDTSGNLVSEFLDRITTNHTFINREPVHFKYLRDVVIPFIEEFEGKKRDMRIWSAGCSNGSEPYTIAMIINEYFGKKKHLWNTDVLATDLSEDILRRARQGVFVKDDLTKVPFDWQRKYFKRYDEENYEIIEDIRKDIIFRRLNLMNEFPFKKKFHLIFCRNVMIYFDNETKYKLVNKFYDCLEDGGYLFIGHSETINKADTKFKYIMPAIYRKEV